MARQNRESVRNLDGPVVLRFIVVPAFVGVDHAYGHNALRFVTLVESLHCCELHGLGARHIDCGAVAAIERQEHTYESYTTCCLDRPDGEFFVTTFDKEPTADADNEYAGQCPAAENGVDELRDCSGREKSPEVSHHVTHLLRIESHADRLLHPRVSHENPECGQRGADSGDPCCGQMEFRAYLLPTEKHNGRESCLKEESENTFDGQGGAEDITHEPGIVAPVRTEFKFKDKTCGNADGEVNAEYGHPELGACEPFLRTGAHIEALHDSHNHRQAQSERHEQPVIDGRHCKLQARPVGYGY